VSESSSFNHGDTVLWIQGTGETGTVKGIEGEEFIRVEFVCWYSVSSEVPNAHPEKHIT